MNLLAQVAPAAADPLAQYLLAAIGVLGTAIAVLFWQLLQSKAAETALAKEIYPAATLLIKTVEDLVKLIEKIERERQGS